jgi:hypothetical protein
VGSPHIQRIKIARDRPIAFLEQALLGFRSTCSGVFVGSQLVLEPSDKQRMHFVAGGVHWVEAGWSRISTISIITVATLPSHLVAVTDRAMIASYGAGCSATARSMARKAAAKPVFRLFLSASAARPAATIAPGTSISASAIRSAAASRIACARYSG